MTDNNYKVRLVPIAALSFASDPASIRAAQVAFDVTPAFSESGGVEYTPVSPVHMPGSIQIYKHTNSRTFEIGAHLISRNVADALKNIGYLQKLRAWRMPYFGQTDTLTDGNRQARASAAQNQVNGTANSSQTLNSSQSAALVKQRVQTEGVQLRGAPPDILYLYAYNNDKIDNRTNQGSIFTPVNLNRIPVVVTNLSITYPEDVDYIPVYDTTRGGPDNTFTQPFPVKMDVSISLAETHSPREFEQFDLAAYKNGNLANF